MRSCYVIGYSVKFCLHRKRPATLVFPAEQTPTFNFVSTVLFPIPNEPHCERLNTTIRMQALAHLRDKLQVDRVPLLLVLLNLVLVLLLEDVLVQDESVLAPLGQEVARDLDGVLDVVDLADVEPVEP